MTPIGGLYVRVSGVDIRTYEPMNQPALSRVLRPLAQGFVDETRSLTESVLVVCESSPNTSTGLVDFPADTGAGFECALDSTLERRGGLRDTVADVAFMARLELRNRWERLNAGAQLGSALALMVECDSALRRVGKVLMALDSAISMAEAVPPRLNYTSELARSLGVRRAYSRLRARLRSLPEPTPDTLVQSMRSAGTVLAKFVGWDVYPDVRVGDRMHLRDLQRRILAWLHPDARDNTLAGMRVWQDFTAFVGMLSQINKRQELVAHDERTIGALVEGARRHPSSWLDAAAQEGLRSLTGLDDELDELLAHESTVAATQWLEALRRVQPSTEHRSQGDSL